VRELQNVMERMAVLTRNGRIQSEDLPAEIRQCESRIANIFLKLPDEGIDLE
jgi:DNA-binding NtrC family response regulator